MAAYKGINMEIMKKPQTETWTVYELDIVRLCMVRKKFLRIFQVEEVRTNQLNLIDIESRSVTWISRAQPQSHEQLFLYHYGLWSKNMQVYWIHAS